MLGARDRPLQVWSTTHVPEETARVPRARQGQNLLCRDKGRIPGCNKTTHFQKRPPHRFLETTRVLHHRPINIFIRKTPQGKPMSTTSMQSQGKHHFGIANPYLKNQHQKTKKTWARATQGSKQGQTRMNMGHQKLPRPSLTTPSKC